MIYASRLCRFSHNILKFLLVHEKISPRFLIIRFWKIQIYSKIVRDVLIKSERKRENLKERSVRMYYNNETKGKKI